MKRREELTRKQQAFVHAYNKGASPAEAYLAAYNVAPGGSVVGQMGNAQKILKLPKVQAAIKEFKDKVAKKVETTVETLIVELEEARTAALTAETAQSAAAVSASMAKAKLLGLDRLQIELTGKNGGPVDIRMSAIESITEAFMALRSK